MRKLIFDLMVWVNKQNKGRFTWLMDFAGKSKLLIFFSLSYIFLRLMISIWVGIFDNFVLSIQSIGTVVGTVTAGYGSGGATDGSFLLLLEKANCVFPISELVLVIGALVVLRIQILAWSLAVYIYRLIPFNG